MTFTTVSLYIFAFTNSC